MKREPFGVQVGQFHAAKLGAPDARRVKEFQHGPVTQPSGSFTSGTASNRSTSGQRQHGLGQALFHPGQLHFAGRVVQDDILPGQPAKEVLERAERLRCVLQPRRWPSALVQRQSQR